MTDKAVRFNELLDQRIVVLDGAMGTLLQSRGLTEKDYRGGRFAEHPSELRGNHDLLSLTRPSLVREVHDAYLAAGADVLKTNTFNATAISQADYGTEALAYEINRAGARIAREAVDAVTSHESPRFVAGVLGPTRKMASISTVPSDPSARDVDFDDLVGAYEEAARGLLDGGVDLLLIETVFDALNAKAAVHALESCFEARGLALPVMISATLHDASARLLSGQTLEAFWCTIAHARPVSVGLNCGYGVAGLRESLRELARSANTRISAHPNAGLPDDLGGYPDSPSIMARHLRKWALEGMLNLVGGCCGAGPAHIQAIADAVRGVPPRRVPSFEPRSALAGLEPLRIGAGERFAVVGERTSVAGSARFKALIEACDYQSAVGIARAQIAAGATMLDVNMDAPLLDGERAMSAFLKTLASDPNVSRVPLMLDSSSWPVLEAGLKCVQGKPVVNSINLSNGEGELLERARAIRRYGAAVVVSAIDEEGPALTCERKVAVCARAYRLLTGLGFPPHDIVFDPLVLAVATGMAAHDRAALDFLEATQEIKRTLPHALVCGGVSNVSFAFRGSPAVRNAMHAVFLQHAKQAGMDLGIVDPKSLVPYEDVPLELRERAEDAVLGRRPDASTRLSEVAPRARAGPTTAAGDAAWRTWPIGRRLEHALVSGDDTYIESDADEACGALGGPLAVIEGPLSTGMSTVGDLFAAGKMFLPEVVRSARVMQKAVGRLMPLVEGRGLAAPRRKALIATVRGDVHDIGKNIVGTVLGCCGFDVVDLGVRVAADRIVERARVEEPALIGLSGLITPSLDEMVRVACALDREGLRVPLLVGGAATSPLHAAVRIAPSYRGLTVWGKDASRAATAARSIIGENGAEYAESVRAEQGQMRAQYHARAKSTTYLPLAEARARKLRLDWNVYDYPRPARLGVRRIDGALEEIQRYIDWTPFFRAWELRGRYPDILRDPGKGEQARRLFADAREMLARIVGERWVGAHAVVGFFAANAVGDDDVEVYQDESRQEVLSTFRFLRQQQNIAGRTSCACLADFVSPREAGRPDHVGVFALTAGIGLEAVVRKFEATHDGYRALLARALCDRLAEAFSEQMHQTVRVELWGYSKGESPDTDALLRGDYRGIRPAMGFPACPDHTEKRPLWDLLDPTRAGIELTETFAMTPTSSTCGMYLAHPEAHYFAVGRVARDQVADYAHRKGIELAVAERWLAPNLGYEMAGGATLPEPARVEDSQRRRT